MITHGGKNMTEELEEQVAEALNTMDSQLPPIKIGGL